MAAISTQVVTTLPKGIQVSGGQLRDLAVTGTTSVNTSIGTSFETVHPLGGIRNEIGSTAMTLKVSSSSGSDKDSGSKAARKVLIRGLNSDFEEVEDTINLNGTNLVESAVSFLRVNHFKVVKVGALDDVNVGDITVYKNDGTTALNQIPIGKCQASIAHYTCPTGQKAYITSYFINVVGTAETIIVVKKGGSDGLQSGKAWENKMSVVAKDSGQPYEMPVPFVLNMGDTIEFRARDLAAGTSIVNIDFQVIKETI